MEMTVEDLDFTSEEFAKYSPPVMKIRVDRLTGPEQRVIEEYMDCPLGKNDHPNFSVGKFNLALAYVMLRRRDPSQPAEDLWKAAGQYSVDVVNPGEVTPTNESASTPKSLSPDISASPSPTSDPSNGGSGTSS